MIDADYAELEKKVLTHYAERGILATTSEGTPVWREGQDTVLRQHAEHDNQPYTEGIHRLVL